MPQDYDPYITPQEDKRRKLTPEQEAQILELYSNQEVKNISELARQFNVSRKTIQHIVKPKTKKLHQENHNTYEKQKKYRTKEKNRIYMQRWRLRKKILGKMNTDTPLPELEAEYKRLGDELKKLTATN